MRQAWFPCISAFAVLITVSMVTRVTAAQVPRAVPAQREGAEDTLVLTLSGVQRLALQQNPELLADRQEIPIARAQVRQARSYTFNPELSGNAPGLASTGTVGEYDVSLMQEVEWAGQWGLRSGAAREGLDRATHAVRNAARLTLGDVSRAYFEALAADRRYAVTLAVLELNERLLTATRIQLREGEISSLEANLAEIEYGRARARVLAARRAASATALELKRLAGLAADRAVRLIDDLPDGPTATTLSADSLVVVALARRPDLAANTAAVSQFETLRRLARRDAIPNLRVGVIADRDGPLDASRLGVGIGWSLPLWNRNRGLVEERAAQRDQATLQRQATELRIRSQVTEAYRAYLAASEEAQVYETSVLEPARKNQGLLETAYRAGKINLPTLLLLRNQILDAELGYWDAWLARRGALIALQTATATLTPDGAPPTNNTESIR